MAKIDVMMFATPNLEVYTKLSIATWEKYCEEFGYDFFHYDQPYYDDLHLAWSKIRSVKEHLLATKADYVLMVDADTIPTSLDISVEKLLELFMHEGKQILFQKDGSDRLKYLYFTHNFTISLSQRRWVLPNAGFILMKNNKEVISFYEEWLERAETSPWASKPPRNQNVLVREMLCQEKYNDIVGYIDTWVVNKFKGKLCQHFSSKSKEEVAQEMMPYYKNIVG